MPADWLTAALNAVSGIPPNIGSAGLTVPPGVLPTPDPSAPDPSAGAPPQGAPPVPGFQGPIGTSPRDPQFATQGTGFLGNLTSFLTNPLTQAAMQGYFGAISAPRSTTNMGRVGIGGATALNTLNQQEALQQFAYPQARADLGLTQQRSIQEAAKTKWLQGQMRPVSPASAQALNHYLNFEQQQLQKLMADPKAQDAEKEVTASNVAYLQSLQDAVQNQGMSEAELMAALYSHNVAKQQADLYSALLKGGQYRTAEELRPLIMDVLKESGVSVPSGTTTPGTPPPSGTAPPGAASGGAAGGIVISGAEGKPIPPELKAELAVMMRTEPGFAPSIYNVRPNAEGKYEFMLAPGQWYKLGPDGEEIYVGS